MPLPRHPFEHQEFKVARVNIDYHVQFSGHFYSVPHPLVKEEVEIRASHHTVQVLYKGKPVTSHVRQYAAGAFTTRTEHMPTRHQKQQQWTPGRLTDWAQKLGIDVLEFTRQLLNSKQHPEQAYRACLGLLNLEREYGAQRLNAACHRAMNSGGRRVANVRSILQSGLDKIPLEQQQEPEQRITIRHENIRGADFFH